MRQWPCPFKLLHSKSLDGKGAIPPTLTGHGAIRNRRSGPGLAPGFLRARLTLSARRAEVGGRDDSACCAEIPLFGWAVEPPQSLKNQEFESRFKVIRIKYRTVL